MTIGGDGTSPLEKEITRAFRELRFCCQWEGGERWFDLAEEVMAFLEEQKTKKIQTRLVMGRGLTPEQVALSRR